MGRLALSTSLTVGGVISVTDWVRMRLVEATGFDSGVTLLRYEL